MNSVERSLFRAWGLGFRIEGSWFRVLWFAAWILGCMVIIAHDDQVVFERRPFKVVWWCGLGTGLDVWDSGFWGFAFEFWGLEFGVLGLVLSAEFQVSCRVRASTLESSLVWRGLRVWGVEEGFRVWVSKSGGAVLRERGKGFGVRSSELGFCYFFIFSFALWGLEFGVLCLLLSYEC